MLYRSGFEAVYGTSLSASNWRRRGHRVLFLACHSILESPPMTLVHEPPAGTLFGYSRLGRMDHYLKRAIQSFKRRARLVRSG